MAQSLGTQASSLARTRPAALEKFDLCGGRLRPRRRGERRFEESHGTFSGGAAIGVRRSCKVGYRAPSGRRDVDRSARPRALPWAEEARAFSPEGARFLGSWVAPARDFRFRR